MVRTIRTSVCFRNYDSAFHYFTWNCSFCYPKYTKLERDNVENSSRIIFDSLIEELLIKEFDELKRQKNSNRFSTVD